MGCGASQATHTQGKYTSQEHQIQSLSTGYFVENRLGEGDFSLFFEPDDALSLKHGDFGRFIIAHQRVTKQVAAIEPIGKASTSRDGLEKHMSILRSLGHPNITRLKEVCEDEASYYLAFEFCIGGGLMEAVEERCMRQPADAVLVATCASFQVLKAVEYMHQKGICHRNLSTDAALLHSKDDDLQKWQVVVHDFAHACHFTKNKRMTEKVNSKEGFRSPEMAAGSGYTQACDIYSCGAILCALLFGNPNPEAGTWRKSLSTAQTLVFRMMTSEAARPTSAECLEDPFFKTMEDIGRGEEISARHLENMQRYCRANKLKKLAIHVSASHLSDPEVLRMKDMFELVDADNSGQVSLAELKKAMQELMCHGGYRARAAIPQDVERLMDLLDVDGSATISYPEFIAAMTDRKHYTTDATCLAVFQIFDTNGDGHINRHELQQALKSKTFKDLDFNLFPAIEEVMSSDKDGDGNIDFEEFKAMMRDSASEDVKLLGRTRDPGKADLLKKSPQDSWAHRF